MIIQCKSCSKKFLVRDRDIPEKGRMVQCGYCSQKWFQTPVKTRTSLKSDIDKNASEMEFEASDGRTFVSRLGGWKPVLAVTRVVGLV